MSDQARRAKPWETPRETPDYDKYVGDQAWHDWRAKGLGASEVAGVLGISPWASPWSVWAAKTGLVPPLEPSEYMEFGHWAERMVGPWFTDRTGLYVVGEQTWCQHPEPSLSWARATVDGFVSEAPQSAPDEILGVLEIKTEGAGHEWDYIPAHHQAQAQWQMFVTGLPMVWFAVLHGRRFRIYTLERDEADIQFMLTRAEHFWHHHVEGNIEPRADSSGATRDALKAAYATETDETVEIPAAMVEALRDAKVRLRLAETEEQLRSNEMRAAIGEATAATVGGMTVATLRAQDRRTVDVKRLEAELPEIAEKYRTTTSTRVLRLKQEKP